MDATADATHRYTADEAGELIQLATKLDDLVERDDLSYEQVVKVAEELGITRRAVSRAVKARERQDRIDTKVAQRTVRRKLRFIRHTAAYVLGVGALVLIDILGGGGWWFFYAAAVWGVVLALHALRFVTGRRGPLERYLTDRELKSP